MHLRVYNYNTLDRVHAWEAHQVPPPQHAALLLSLCLSGLHSFRCHSSQPGSHFAAFYCCSESWCSRFCFRPPTTCSSSSGSCVLFLVVLLFLICSVCSWEKNWQCIRVFEGHSHYVMQICFNPKVCCLQLFPLGLSSRFRIQMCLLLPLSIAPSKSGLWVPRRPTFLWRCAANCLCVWVADGNVRGTTRASTVWRIIRAAISRTSFPAEMTLLSKCGIIKTRSASRRWR